MNKLFKKFNSAEFIGVILLAVLVVFAGYMVYFQKDFKVSTKIKSDSNSKNLSGYNFQNYYDDYYDEYYYDEDNYYEDDYYYEDNYYDDYYYEDNYDDYNYEYINNNYNNYNQYYDYGDTRAPAIQWSASKILNQYQNYDPMEDVSAHHLKFGDVTDNIEIIYNDVNTSIPGIYTTVYKACNYPGSIYCRSVSRTVTVREQGYDVDDEYYDYTKGPKWNNHDSVSCSQGSTRCSTYNISEPIATDPVTGRELTVELVDGYVDINTPGTYALIYSAETKRGVTGTVSKIVTITKGTSSNISSSNKTQSKYISNYHSNYYDDGTYRGYLNQNNSSNNNKKYVNNIEWTNVVTYTYRCDVEGQYGLAGWSLSSTDKSNGQSTINADNHPTIFYEENGYYGLLNKTSFYLKDSEGKLASDLGYCTNVGTTKQVSRTWVGLYSGYIESHNNYNTTYSGYVYRY